MIGNGVALNIPVFSRQLGLAFNAVLGIIMSLFLSLGKRTPVTENDIPDIVERFKHLDKETDRKRTEKSFLVPKQEIVGNGYDLNINKYKEVEYIPVEYPPTSEIMANIRELEMEIGNEMDELEKLLGL